jgi:hypothetical protein
MFTHRSVVGRIKGLRNAVRLNDFRLAQRLRMALTATLHHIDEPVRDEPAHLVDVSGLWVRNIGDRHKIKREIRIRLREMSWRLARLWRYFTDRLARLLHPPLLDIKYLRTKLPSRAVSAPKHMRHASTCTVVSGPVSALTRSER